MTYVDTINALFEGGGAIFLCLNVRRLLRDKSVKGVSLVTTAWWAAWGFWNVHFYAATTNPLSMWAGVAVVLVNAVWLGLALWYAHKERQAPAYTLDVLMFFTPDNGRTWQDDSGPLEASELTDRLQDHHCHSRRAACLKHMGGDVCGNCKAAP
jgi:hypothetical protein